MRAWIEMGLCMSLQSCPRRRPLHEGVDWNYECQRLGLECSVALFMRAWIEISGIFINKRICYSRPLHEGVDWNLLSPTACWIAVCRPLHEGVDWNPSEYVHLCVLRRSPSSWGRGLKFNIFVFRHIYNGRPLHEGVDWNWFANIPVTQ